MAGTGDNIGNLEVSVTGDFSELQSAIDGAVKSAESGADAIQSAFSSATAGDALAQSITNVGDAAQSSAAQVQGFGSAAQSAGDSAAAAEPGIAGMAEQFAALAEALVITEGLKEFGQEALKAAGTVQSVTIGLTQLTGSAEKANEIIEQVKQLAATEPFAFPEIAPTIQKMVALGVSAEQIPGVMQAVANAASATGNSFQQVANSFDRMSLSGTVNARSLVQLGISTQQLGAAMNVTATQVKTAFAALDQSQRIEVLEQALSKFAGAAEAQAQGIAGQWQIFQNQFEEVMVGVGTALAPVVGELLSFGKTVLTAVQEGVDAFNKLPAPVKDTAVALGLVVAAVAPLAAAISAVGFAVIGFNAAWSTGAAILETFSGTAGTAAVAEGALAEAAVVATTAEEAQTIATAELATAQKALGTAGTEAAAGMSALAGGVAAAAGAFAGWSLGKWIADNLPTLSRALSDAGVSAMALATNNIPALIAILNDTQAPLLQVGQGFETLAGSMSDAGAHVTDVTNKLSTFIQPLTDVTKKQIDANTAVGQASVAYQLAKVALDNAIPGTQQYALALQVVQRAAVQLDTAQQAMAAHGKDWADTIGGITQKIADAQTKFASLTTIFNRLSAAAANGAQNSGLLAEVYTKLETAAKDSGNAFASYQGILAQVNTTTTQGYAVFQQLGAAYGTLLSLQQSGVDVTAQLATVYTQWQTAAQKVGESVSTAAGAMAQAKQAASGQIDSINSLAGAFVKLASIQQPTEQDQLAINDVFKKLMTSADAMGASITVAGNSLVFAAKEGTTATPALQAWLNTQNATFTSANNLINVNGKLSTTIAALFGAYNQATAAAKANADAVAAAGKAAADHANSMAGEIQALQQQANALNVSARAAQDAASAGANVTLMTKNFQIAANSQIQTLQNAVDAFNNLNSTTATTAQDQIALQNSFDKVQQLAQAAGLQVKFVGDQLVFATNAATSADPKFQALVADMNKLAQAAQGAANQVANAASQVTSLAQDVDSFDNILGRSPSGGGSFNVKPGSSVHIGEPSATGAPFGSQDGIVPIPPDPNPGSDYFDYLTGTWRSIPAGYTPINSPLNQSGLNQQGYGSGGAPSQASPIPSGGGNSSPTGGMVAFGLAVGAATSAVTAVATAATSAATPLGAFATIIPAASSATAAVTQNFTNTGASMSAFAGKALGAQTTTDDYNAAVAAASDASNAYTAALQQGADQNTLDNLWQAVVGANQVLTQMTGEVQSTSDAFQGLRQSTPEITAHIQTFGNSLLGTDQRQKDYSDAVAQSTADQQAYSDALAAYQQAVKSGTGVQDALNKLNQAWADDVAAADEVTRLTGQAKTGDPFASTAALATNVTADQVLGITPVDQATADRAAMAQARDAYIAAMNSGTASQNDLAKLLDAANSATDTYNRDAATAQADLVNAQNAYTNAIRSGTATQQDLNNLSQAVFAAQQEVSNAPFFQGNARGPSSKDYLAPPPGIGTPGGPNSTGFDPSTLYSPSVPSYSAPSSGGGISIPMTFTTGTLVGTNGMQQLSDMVMTKVVGALRQAGVKI